MWLVFLLYVSGVGKCVATGNAYNTDDKAITDLLQHVETMKTKHKAEIKLLSDKFVETERLLTRTLSRLNTDVASVREGLSTARIDHQHHVQGLTDTIAELRHQLGSCKKTQETTISVSETNARRTFKKSLDYTMANVDNKDMVLYKRDISFKEESCQHTGLYQVQEKVAFTAYLDHDLDDIGSRDVITFNKVLLNDGNCYNAHTGEFVAPIDGVYHLNFVVAERDEEQIYVQLVVNGNNMVDAVAESVQDRHDSQGGNAANLKLTKGDTVTVKHRIYGDHIEGSRTSRVTSFSGFLLYQTVSIPIVGK